MGEHRPQQREPTAHAVSRAHAPQQRGEATTATPGRIAAAPRVDFGEQIIGETAFQNVRVFNLDADIAFVSTRIEGSSAFQIASSPPHLQASSAAFDPDAVVRVAYASRTRSSDSAFLVATLRWRDGSSETVRIALQAATRGANESTHEEEASRRSEEQAQVQQATQKAKADAAEEARISAIEAKGGSEDKRIAHAATALGARLRTLGTKQLNGVTEAAEIVRTYKRKLPPPPPPNVVAELATFALNVASAGLAVRLQTAIRALEGAAAGWSAPTAGESGYGFETPGSPGSKQLASGEPIAKVASILSTKLLEVGKAKVGTALKADPLQPEPVAGQAAIAESLDQQLEYFSAQRDLIADRIESSELAGLQIRRSLVEYDNPRDAQKAAEVLNKAGEIVERMGTTARTLQAEETTKGWIRLVSQSALGSISATNARKAGLAQTKDGSSTADISHADGSTPYDGVVELEFIADANHALAPVTVASAKLFGISNKAVQRLHLDSRSLRSAGLPIRAHSSASSTPVQVSLARDEAGNVHHTDESGAAGMQSSWLSRRGGRPGSESAAQKAAKAMMEDLAAKTLPQLGVTLSTDDGDA